MERCFLQCFSNFESGLGDQGGKTRFKLVAKQGRQAPLNVSSPFEGEPFVNAHEYDVRELIKFLYVISHPESRCRLEIFAPSTGEKIVGKERSPR